MRRRKYSEILEDDFLRITNQEAPAVCCDGTLFVNTNDNPNARGMKIMPVLECDSPETFSRYLHRYLSGIGNKLGQAHDYFSANVKDIMVGALPDWKLVKAEICRECIFLDYANEKLDAVEYVILNARGRLQFALQLAPTRMGFVPTYTIDARFDTYISDDHYMEIYEDLGYVCRHITFKDEIDGVVHLDIEEYCGY